MALDFESSFRKELYKKYEKCPKCMIPREEYCATIAKIKKASQDPKSKSRLEYYLLEECEIPWCGDSEKLIKKHWTKEASPIYRVSVEDSTRRVLQSDKGTEIAAEVIQELKLLWPLLSLVRGKARYPQSQGSPKGDIKQMRLAWMADNNSLGLDCGDSLCPVLKSTTCQSGINCSPYTARFGTNPKCGLSSTSLPSGIINQLRSQHNLLSALSALSNDSAASTYPEDTPPPTSDAVVGIKTGTTAKLKVRPVPIPQAPESIHPDPPNSPPAGTPALTGPSLLGHRPNHPLQNPAPRAALCPRQQEEAWAARGLQAELPLKRGLQMGEN